jgi:hypothetical protein
MKCVIFETDGFSLATLSIDPALAHCLKRAAQAAQALLTRQRHGTEAGAPDPGLTVLWERGATRLALLALAAETRLMVDPTFLTDAHATTCLLASQGEAPVQARSDLKTVLEFLAAILPCSIRACHLPAWGDLQHSSPHPVRLEQIYENLRHQQTGNAGPSHLKMDDALILRDGLRLKAHPAILLLWEDLNEQTARHRHALSHLQRSET